MKTKFKPRTAFGTLAVMAVVVGLLGGCATTGPEKKPTLVPTGQGTVVYLEKYEFKPPPSGWAMMKNVEGGDFELGFFRFEKGEFPSQTTFMYDDQPYGSSQDLE